MYSPECRCFGVLLRESLFCKIPRRVVCFPPDESAFPDRKSSDCFPQRSFLYPLKWCIPGRVHPSISYNSLPTRFVYPSVVSMLIPIGVVLPHSGNLSFPQQSFNLSKSLHPHRVPVTTDNTHYPQAESRIFSPFTSLSPLQSPYRFAINRHLYHLFPR